MIFRDRRKVPVGLRNLDRITWAERRAFRRALRESAAWMKTYVPSGPAAPYMVKKSEGDCWRWSDTGRPVGPVTLRRSDPMRSHADQAVAGFRHYNPGWL